MGEILGIGCPHGPHIRFTDETMANNYFRLNFRNKKTPAFWRDSKNWPEQMREEWGDDEGVKAAGNHRKVVVDGYRAAREAIDDFKPDFVLMFGDDQYENFKEDIFPPFSVFAHDEFEILERRGGIKVEYGPKGILDTGLTNVGLPMERPPLQTKFKGAKKIGTFIATELIHRGFEVGWSTKLNNVTTIGHAFSGTLDYLDWDRKGFDYPIIPFHVNCYGEDMRMPNLGSREWIGRLPDPEDKARRIEGGESLPPGSPPPWRCYDLGKMVGQIIKESPHRAVIIGSSSWSHASLTNMHGFLWGDVDCDRQRYEELKAGQHHKWREFDREQLRASGQHEMRNWICLAGAMEGRRANVLAYAETYIFNSCKCVAVFPVNGQASQRP